VRQVGHLSEISSVHVSTCRADSHTKHRRTQMEVYFAGRDFYKIFCTCG